MKLTNEHQVSEAVRRLNPSLFSVGGISADKPKPEQRRALEQTKPEKANSRRRMEKHGQPIIRVGIIRCGGKVFDSDNLEAGYKPLRDSISESLGIDDGDSRIEFVYSQVRSGGRRGTIVMMEFLEAVK